MKKRVLVAMLMAVCAAAVAAEPPQGKGHAHHHAHDAVIDVPEGPDAPTLALEAQKDPVGGWNVHVRTTHFSFAPERVNGPHRPGEGHGHLYVDGKKVARIYGPWFHLGPLPPGKHVLRATLNANSHEELSVGGRKLEASIELP